MFCSCIFYLHWMIKNLFLKHTYLHCYWWTSRISVQGWIEKHLYLRECFHIFSSKFWFVIEIGYALVNAPATMVCGTDNRLSSNEKSVWPLIRLQRRILFLYLLSACVCRSPISRTTICFPMSCCRTAPSWLFFSSWL